MTEEAPLPSERRARLIARVRETGSARVSDLSRVLGVTPVTVRRDLALLVAEGTLEKVHGGARIPAGAARSAGAAEPEESGDGGLPTIGMVVPSLDYYWPEVIRGARGAAHGAARLILRGASYDVDQVRRQVTALVGDDGAPGVDGLLVAPPVEGPDATELGEWLAGLNLPVVLMERRLAAGRYREPLESVATDHALGSGTAARHLAERGHRRVGLVTSRTPHTTAIRSGFFAVADELGLDVVLDLQTVPLSDAGWAGDAASVLDKCTATGATALLVHSDREAISLVEQAQERGMRVPADLAVVAYDDEVAALADPPLTAVRPPRAAIGAGAVELLTRRLGITRADGESTRDDGGAGSDPAAGADRPVHRIELSPHLVVRASSAARA
ncbi:transcriptional regulator, GntR family [Promicromonospora umidemergens]|uniref:Substrate-binding domain-containing protein n=1 Tax=Promicromonospora umidemergens TaxID=629679 RepID=A0ABP8X563_9MICO|nr:substrate-binding domain-containing protein [Promicromonospora umidemergens]MCP2285125.1 transcriptional regulator, GntR family [Promicromonospora umidemergens]